MADLLRFRSEVEGAVFVWTVEDLATPQTFHPPDVPTIDPRSVPLQHSNLAPAFHERTNAIGVSVFIVELAIGERQASLYCAGPVAQ